MGLQRGAIILTFIAEQVPKGIQPEAWDEAIPVVVADFVAKMPEQRSEGFCRVLAVALPLGIVRLGKVDRNQTAFVAGDNRCGFGEAAAGAGKEGRSRRCRRPTRSTCRRRRVPADHRIGRPAQYAGEKHRVRDEAGAGGKPWNDRKPSPGDDSTPPPSWTSAPKTRAARGRDILHHAVILTGMTRPPPRR